MRQTDRQTKRQTERQTEKRTERQTKKHNRQTNRQCRDRAQRAAELRQLRVATSRACAAFCNSKLGLFSVLGEIWFSGWLFSCLLAGFLACCCCCLLVFVSLSVFFFVCFALLHLHFERGTLNHPSISGRVSCRYVSLPNANFVIYFSLSLSNTLGFFFFSGLWTR